MWWKLERWWWEGMVEASNELGVWNGIGISARDAFKYENICNVKVEVFFLHLFLPFPTPPRLIEITVRYSGELNKKLKQTENMVLQGNLTEIVSSHHYTSSSFQLKTEQPEFVRRYVVCRFRLRSSLHISIYIFISISFRRWRTSAVYGLKFKVSISFWHVWLIHETVTNWIRFN